ncbi:hypothetical protein GCM10023238_31420 [Streptomyces heliomycini]
MCEATNRVTEDGKTAIIFKPAMPTKENPQSCTQLAVIDLAAGKEVWTKTAKSGTMPISFNNVTLSGGTVAAGSTAAAPPGRSPPASSCGRPRRPTPATTRVRRRREARRGAQVRFVRPAAAAHPDHRPEEREGDHRVQDGRGHRVRRRRLHRPAGRRRRRQRLRGGRQRHLGLLLHRQQDGKLRTRISAPGEEYAARCDAIYKLEKCTGLAVGGDRLYIATEEHEGGGKSYVQTNEVVAFDLATGKQTGQRADAGDGYTITPLRMDGGNVLAYKRPPYDKGGQIVSIDGGTFKQTTLMENRRRKPCGTSSRGCRPNTRRSCSRRALCTCPVPTPVTSRRLRTIRNIS